MNERTKIKFYKIWSKVIEDNLLKICNNIWFYGDPYSNEANLALCMKYTMQLRGSIVRFLKYARHGEVNFGFIAQSQLYNGFV